MCLSAHGPFWTRFITLSSASLPGVNLMHLRTEDQLCHPAVLSNMSQAEDLAIFHRWGFLQSPLLKKAELVLEQYESSAPSNTDQHHHGELLHLYTDACIPNPSPITGVGSFPSLLIWYFKSMEQDWRTQQWLPYSGSTGLASSIWSLPLDCHRRALTVPSPGSSIKDSHEWPETSKCFPASSSARVLWAWGLSS